MSGKSKIEWTEQTWNPIVGCSIVSPGCTNCYAMKMAARIQKMNLTGGSNSNYVNHYDGTTRSVNGNVVWTGKIAIAPDKIFLQPLSRKAPTTYFVNSMGDLFHEDVPDEWIERAFAVMALAPQHTFQVLTKRASRMRQWFESDRADRVGLAILTIVDRIPHGHRRVPWPLANVWLGVSAERQQEWDERTGYLRQTPAAVRFVSVEPMLGPIEGRAALLELDWIIVGGESGPNSRLMHPAWASDLRDQCAWRSVPFFFKQWGTFTPVDSTLSEFLNQKDERHIGECICSADGQFTGFPAHGVEQFQVMRRVGKKAAGRLLDGVEYNGFPSRGSI